MLYYFWDLKKDPHLRVVDRQGPKNAGFLSRTMNSPYEIPEAQDLGVCVRPMEF